MKTLSYESGFLVLVNRLGNFHNDPSLADFNYCVFRVCDGVAGTHHDGHPHCQETMQDQEENQNQKAECRGSSHLSIIRNHFWNLNWELKYNKEILKIFDHLWTQTSDDTVLCILILTELFKGTRTSYNRSFCPSPLPHHYQKFEYNPPSKNVGAIYLSQ